jgi:glycosyl transferase family 2
MGFRGAVEASVERPARIGHKGFLRTRATARMALVLAFALAGVLLATRLHGLLHDPLLSLYSVLTISVTALVMYLAFAKYRDPALDAPTRVWQPRVSCLVAVKNEYEVIDRCIASLLASSYADLEVIVVDDASTDGTRERLIELERRHRQLRLLLLPKSVKKKKALVHGLKYATGEILLFTDSDCVLAPDAVEQVVDTFAARPDVGAVSGDVRALNGDLNFLTKTQDVWYDGQFSIWKAAESVFGAVTCISGPLAAFRREAVYNFFPAWAEDSFLGKEFPFATDRQLTGYLLGSDSIGPSLKRKYSDSPFVRDEGLPDPALADRVRRVRSRLDGRPADAPQPREAAGPLEEELHSQPLLHRPLLLAQGPRPLLHLLRPRGLHRRDAVHGGSVPALPPAQR